MIEDNSIFFVWTRCTMHTTPTQKLFCLHVFRQSVLGTTKGRLHGPKMGNSTKCLSQGHSDALLHQKSNQGFVTFRLLSRRLYQLRHAVANMPSCHYWDIARAASSFVFTQRFFWQMSSSFHFFANNSNTAGRRKLKFSHNVGVHQS